MKFLGHISNLLSSNNIDYEFQEWTNPIITFPYWTGDYTENEYSSEQGHSSYTFMLTRSEEHTSELQSLC